MQRQQKIQKANQKRQPIVQNEKPIQRVEPKQSQPKKNKENFDGLEIPKAPFNRLVREIAQSFSKDIRFEADAIHGLQVQAESELVKLIGDAKLGALHAHRTTLMQSDMHLVLQLQDPHLFNQVQKIQTERNNPQFQVPDRVQKQNQQVQRQPDIDMIDEAQEFPRQRQGVGNKRVIKSPESSQNEDIEEESYSNVDHEKCNPHQNQYQDNFHADYIDQDYDDHQFNSLNGGFTEGQNQKSLKQQNNQSLNQQNQSLFQGNNAQLNQVAFQTQVRNPHQRLRRLDEVPQAQDINQEVEMEDVQLKVRFPRIPNTGSYQSLIEHDFQQYERKQLQQQQQQQQYQNQQQLQQQQYLDQQQQQPLTEQQLKQQKREQERKEREKYFQRLSAFQSSRGVFEPPSEPQQQKEESSYQEPSQSEQYSQQDEQQQYFSQDHQVPYHYESNSELAYDQLRHQLYKLNIGSMTENRTSLLFQEHQLQPQAATAGYWPFYSGNSERKPRQRFFQEFQ